jgi:hypothetical protein
VYRALNRRRVLDLVSGARRFHLLVRALPPGVKAVVVPKELADAPTDVVDYDGLVTLHPPDDWSGGSVMLAVVGINGEPVAETDLVSYVYDQLQVPREDGVLPYVRFRGRVTIEVHPDNDARWLLG